MGATQAIEIDVDDLARRRDEAVRRKVQWFGSGRVDGIVPIASPHPELLGQSVRAFEADDAEDVTVLVDRPARYLDVDPGAPVIPALVSGVVRDARGRPRDARLAVAVNGVVLATTATYGFPRGRSGAWSALVPPGGFRRGRNELEVFVIDEGQPTRVRRAYALGDPSSTLNLVSRGARTYWAISQDGFYQAEEGSMTWYRWTKGGATVTLPFASSPAPRSLRVGLWAVRPGGTPLRLTVNDCVVFEGHVDAPWYRTFSLDACGARAITGRETKIGISSGVFVPGGQDARTLGVAVAVLNLYPDPWPPPPPAAGGTKRADLQVVDEGEPIVRGGIVTVALENRGDSIWLGPDAATKEEALGFEMTWRAAGKNAILAHVNVPIARTFYPDDRERFALPATPLEPLAGTAWDLTIRLVDGQGRPVAMEHSCHVRVRSSAGQS
jgi:hypothetical protein